jgi:putative DNA-invertase from lambdoid prophage Rac
MLRRVPPFCDTLRAPTPGLDWSNPNLAQLTNPRSVAAAERNLVVALTAPDLIVILDLPGLLADHLRAAGDGPIRQALTTGQIIRRGQGHSVRLAAPLALHRAALEHSVALVDVTDPAARKAYRVCSARITAAEAPPSMTGPS